MSVDGGTTSRRLASAGIVLVLCAASAPASAQKRKAAVEACAAASEAAQSLTAERRLIAARDKLLACARPECPGPIRRDCDDLLSQVDAATPSIVLGARDSQGRDLVDVRVSLDGTPVQQTLDGRSIPVDPGTHVLRFERATGAAVEQSIVAKESEKNRLVSVQFAGDAASGPPGAAPAPAVGNELAPPTTPWPGYALAGVAVVGGGVFAYLDASGQSDFDGCKTGSCDVSALQTKRIVTWSVLGVAAVAAGAALWILVAHSSHRSSAVAISPWGIGGTF
jgi:hypothetical protein